MPIHYPHSYHSFRHHAIRSDSHRDWFDYSHHHDHSLRHSILFVLTVLVFMLATLFSGRLNAADIQPGTVVYKIVEGQDPQDLKGFNALLRSQGLVSERTLDGSGITIATFDHIGREVAIANILRSSGAVEFAEPDYAIAPGLAPNDSSYSSQWHHQTIQSEAAWDVTTGSPSVLVGVCDTGFDADHPDLSANLRLDLAFNAQDGTNYIADFSGHGTGTAGVIGAVGNNALGYAGVNWDVDIIPVRIAISDTNSSAYISTMATCIEYSADQGARVVNLSYGGIQYATIDAAAQYLRSKNGLLFMSAGNDGAEFPDFPDYTSFIGVGATDSNNNKASFSSWGDYVDLTAPGVGIRTTFKDGGYISYSGTSFSSPMTAGVAALMVAANPGLTPEQIENGLFSTATDIGAVGDDNVFGHGLINAAAAVNYARNVSTFIAPVAVLEVEQSTQVFGSPFYFHAGNSSDADGNIVSYLWNFGDGNSSQAEDPVHEYAQAGTYQVSLTVTDNDGLSHSATTLVQVTNELPVVQIQASTLSGLAPLAVDFFSEGTQDPDGQIVRYEWDLGDGTVSSQPLLSHTFTEAGQYRVSLTVTDNAGAQNGASLNIEVVDPYQVIAPSQLNASVDAQTVTLSWMDNSTNENRFVIERAMKIRGKYSFEAIAEVGANVTTYVDEGLELGTYQYRVMAQNDYDSSSTDAILVKVETLSNVTPPDPEPSGLTAPTDLSANFVQVDGLYQVFLTWSDTNPTQNVTFIVERGVKQPPVITYSEIATVAENAELGDYMDSVAAGTYYYQVKAINAAGEVSDYSSVLTLRLK